MRTLLFFLSVSIWSSCHFGLEFVKGSGNVISQTRPFSGFNSVDASGSINVEIEKASDYKVEVEADDNVMPYIITDREGDRLKVRLKNNVNIRSSSGIHVRVKMPVLTAVHIAGSGTVKSLGQVTGTEKIKLSIAGSGDLEMDVNSPVIEMSIAGSGKAVMKGETRDLDIHISGSGDYWGENLKSEHAEVSISGSGNAHVFASRELNVTVAGSGDIVYLGSPKISKSIVGSGSVRPKN